MRKNIILTGVPRSGKSTLLRNVAQTLDHAVGFVTDEVREQGERIGFDMVTHTGMRKQLARVGLDSDLQVSRYGVDTTAVSEVLSVLQPEHPDDVIYVDEIGQMQIIDAHFVTAVRRALSSQYRTLMTLTSVFEHPFVDEVKTRSDVMIVAVDPTHTTDQVAFVRALLGKIGKAQRYVLEPQRFVRNGDSVVAHTEHGVRALQLQSGKWQCDCDFYAEHAVCSHVLAVEELGI